MTASSKRVAAALVAYDIAIDEADRARPVKYDTNGYPVQHLPGFADRIIAMTAALEAADKMGGNDVSES